jgi:hypothetical protein
MIGTLSSPQKRAISIIVKDAQESKYRCGKERGSEGYRISNPGPFDALRFMDAPTQKRRRTKNKM